MYTKQSTANPYGFRPFNSRLGYYKPARFAVPTTSMSQPMGLSGLAGAKFPMYPTFANRRNPWLRRDTSGAPIPQIYRPPEMSGLGVMFAEGDGGFVPRSGIVATPRIFGPIGPTSDGSTPIYAVDANGNPIVSSVNTPTLVNPNQPVAPAAITPTGQPTIATGSVPVMSANGSSAGTATTAPTSDPIGAVTSWLSQSLIPNVPNYWLAIGGAAALMLMGHNR